jgi:predicted RNase H-like HicB family nuclease
MRMTASVTRDGDWFVAQCLEVDVCSQGESREAAVRNLTEALELYFEDEESREIPEASIEYLDVAIGQ